MQEVDLEELNNEKDLEEETVDPDSTEALEELLRSMNIKSSKDIPALKFASNRVKKILKNYCTQGNSKIRKNKIIEFYKCLDWIPFEEMDFSILNKFKKEEEKILLKEIKMYLNQKDDKRKRASEWRDEYKTRVINYYKEKVPKQIKLQLEGLRDFELNLVGHDRNWQYYFRLKSFKSIDEFLNHSTAERENIYNNFKLDVHSFKKNRERNLAWKEESHKSSNTAWDDDLISSINWEYHKKQPNNNDKQLLNKDLTRIQDYSILGLANNSRLDEVKKSYRNLAKIHHPDKPGGNTEKMKAINASYQRIIQFLKDNS